MTMPVTEWMQREKRRHQEVVDGVKATFNVKTMEAAMKEMGMAMPKGVKETHHHLGLLSTI